ncbi:MAG TPA: serine/threonine-protein kinase [Tepidisphaeraceae bacterium]|nr:serine/threonine-protein kinase [Tepidisphaeraceae bacterium]
MSLSSGPSLTANTATLPKGIFGYPVVGYLGEGAGSNIYAVMHPLTKQLYALKHVVRKTDKDARFIEQLENEYHVGSQISHAGLRKSIDMKTTKSFFMKTTEAALVLELFDGVPLDVECPHGMVDLVRIFLKTAEAMEALHNAGFVHCDLKPNNILLNPGGMLKVIDLGQACPIGTAKKRIQGTPDYISPEQVRLQPVTPRTDVFNFGATMYWCLTGRKFPTLFTAGKSKNSFVVDQVIISPHQVNPMVPETLSNFVMECTRINPMKRPADMVEPIRRLEIIFHGISRNAQNFGVA